MVDNMQNTENIKTINISIEKMNKEDAEYWKAEYRRKKSAK